MNECDWVCPHCKAPIGVIRKVNHVNRLVLEDRGLVITGAVKVRCLACGHWRTWTAPEDALRRLASRYTLRKQTGTKSVV